MIGAQVSGWLSGDALTVASLVLVQCATPLVGLGLRLAFGTTLCLGPALALAASAGRAAAASLCLAAALLREKMAAMRVLLLPLADLLHHVDDSRRSLARLKDDLVDRTDGVLRAAAPHAAATDFSVSPRSSWSFSPD